MFSKRNKYITLALSVAVAFSSCNKALDINDNPNAATESTPELVLPQAIVRTSQIVPSYSTYGGRIMYFANAGGVSGWGSGFLDYNYSTSNEAGLWSSTYDNLMDYQYVINNTEGVAGLESFYHAAQILRAYNFANLVDTYNDIPYSEALQGNSNVYPKYDSAPEIYADLGTRLDAAVAYFKTAENPATFNSSDVIFGGDETSWAQFANTLKLKLIIKGQGKVTFATTTVDAVGIIEDDVIVNPTFTRIDGKQNPMWNLWAYSAAGNAVGTWGTQFIPTHFVLAFYDGYKISDDERAAVTFANGLSVPKNQLGVQNNPNPPTGLAPTSWVLRTSAGTIGANDYTGIGLIKGPSAGQPILLAAEANFLAAEAVVKGLMTGDAKAYFDQGIKASYLYLNKNESDEVASGVDEDAYFLNYVATNSTNNLVNFTLATTNEAKLGAIITQKYIAMNFLFGHEAWNEYRRTGYPSIINPVGNQPYPNNRDNARNTFVSVGSVATTTDRLPTRILYPNTEFAYNGANIPEVDKFTSKIFWAR